MKKCSALVEFENINAAKLALNIEIGFVDSPLTIKALFQNTESRHIFTQYPCIPGGLASNQSLEELEKNVFAKILKK